MDVARGDSIGASVPEGMYTVAQFAAKVGVSADTIRRWCDDGHLTPADTVERGQLTIRLFSEDQVKACRTLAGQTGYMVNREAS